VIKRVSEWFDDRVGAASFVRSALNKVFPDHWSFMLGEIALYSFVILVLTGVFLSFFFDASLGETVY
jgi:ubiquinol-cytochrome c reductase cytochrome b subunit